MDFCNIIDLKLFQVYILGIIDVRTRSLISFSVTYSPNRQWILQQFKNLAIEDVAFPRYLIIDNDAIYGNWIDQTFFEYFDIEILRINYRSLWENGKIERFWKTLQIECIDRIHFKNGATLNRFCMQCEKYYNEIRPHQSLDGCIPDKKYQTIAKVDNLNTFRYKKKKHMHASFT